MGHLRLGRLPRSQNWRTVIALVDQAPEEVAGIAGATAHAADARLRHLGSDPSLGYCLWLLTRLAAASRTGDFESALRRAGVTQPTSNSALAYISELTNHARVVVSGYGESGVFGELATIALRGALLETVGTHTQSLFQSTLDDLQRTFYGHSTPQQFGDLTRRYFAAFTSRTLRYFVETELSNHVGPGHALRSIEESGRFVDALDLHARQAAVIVEQFASDWYSKHNWETGGEISQQETQAFVAVAVSKLRQELARR